MSKCFLTVILLWQGVILASDQITDPIIRYTKRVIDEQKRYTFDYWESSMLDQPSGGMIARFNFDVTGDGREDLLVASTISTDGKWALYIASDDGYFESPDSVYLGSYSPGAYIRKENGVLIMTGIYSRPDWISVLESRFLPNGKIESTLKMVEDFEKVQNIKRQDGWPEKMYGEGFVFKNIEVCSLRSILLDPIAKWYPYSDEYGLRGQHKALSKEIQLVLFNDDFTPNVASEALQRKVENRITFLVREDGEFNDQDLNTTNEESNPSSRREENKMDIPSPKASKLQWLLVFGCVVLLGILLLGFRLWKKSRAS